MLILKLKLKTESIFSLDTSAIALWHPKSGLPSNVGNKSQGERDVANSLQYSPLKIILLVLILYIALCFTIINKGSSLTYSLNYLHYSIYHLVDTQIFLEGHF